MKRHFILLPLWLIITACSQSTPTTDTTTLEASSAAWEAAWNAKDIDAVVNLYTADARLLPPDAQMVSGHDDIRVAVSEMINDGLALKLTVVEATVLGDLGNIVGQVTMQVAGEIIGTGKYVEIWHRGTDGKWLIANDIFNNDPSPKPQMTMTHLMITHQVGDAAKWAAAWTGEDSRKKLFTDNGAGHVHAFHNGNNAGLVIAVKDMDALNAMLTSDAGKAAAAEDTVKAETIVMMTEVE